MTHGAGGHTDRTEQVGLIFVVVASRSAVVGRRDRGDPQCRELPEPAGIDRVNVTEGQAKIDDKRNQRKP